MVGAGAQSVGRKRGGWGRFNQADAYCPPFTPEQCSQKPAKDYAQFYYVEGLGGKLACVTKGTSGTKLSPNCHERGSQLQRSSPAACEHPAPLRPAPTLPGGRTALATTVVEQG